MDASTDDFVMNVSRPAASLAMACLAALAPVNAAIPQHGQIGLASQVDAGVEGTLKPRHGLTFLSAGLGAPTIAPDPTDGDRRTLGFLNVPAGAAAWRKFPFEARPDVGLIEYPDEFTVETDVYLSGPQQSYDFFTLNVDLEGKRRTIGVRTNDSTSGQVDYPGVIGRTTNTISQPLLADGWRRVRLHYRAATTPGRNGSGDGRLDLWMKNDLAAGSWTRVLVVNDAASGAVRGFGIGLGPTGVATEASAYYRHLAWRSGNVTSEERDTLWIDHGANLGAQWHDGEGTVAQRFVFHYDRNLYGAGSGVTARIEYTNPADTSFSNATLTAPITPNEQQQWTGTATVVGLDPGSQYLYRTIYETAAGHPIEAAPAEFKTMSVPNGDPGVIRFAFGGDSSATERYFPHHAQQQMLDEDLHFVLHLGDVNYHDG